MNKAIAYAAAAAAHLCATAPTQADIADDLADFWGRTGGGTNITRPMAYEGQRAGYVTLGSLYVRSAPRNSNLASIQLPSARAGCGGIDIFGGAFSFLSAEELIALMENIMASAAGFAFELALESLSPAVQETVAKLRDLAQKVNSMNINSCETGQLLVSSVWPKIDAASQHICQIIGPLDGAVADRAKARHDCGVGGQHVKTLNNAKGALKDHVPVNVNYAWRASRKNSFLNADDDLAEFFMTLTGTIIVTGAADDDGAKGQVSYEPRAFTAPYIKALIEGGTVEILRCDNDPEDRCLKPAWKAFTFTEEKSLFSRVVEILNGINDALDADDALPPEAPGLIGMTSVPVYETLKTARQVKYHFVGDEIALMAELVAIDFAMLYTRDALEEMTKLAANTEGLGDQLAEYREQVRTSFSNFTALRREAAEKYGDAVATLTRLQAVKATLASEDAGWIANQVNASY